MADFVERVIIARFAVGGTKLSRAQVAPFFEKLALYRLGKLSGLNSCRGLVFQKKT
jgi:hypothetical protein